MLERMALLAPEWTERNPADVGVAARRAAGVRGRRAVVPAGRRGHRGLPGHRPQPRLAAPARPARRLPRARRLQRARLGAGARSNGADVVAAGRHHAADAASRGLRRRIEPSTARPRGALAARPGRLRDGRRRPCCTATSTSCGSGPGAADCCLPAGATTATLRGAHPRLRAGDVRRPRRDRRRRHRSAEDADPAAPLPGAPRRRAPSTDPAGALFPGGADRRHRDPLAPRRRAALPAVHRRRTASRPAVAWGNIVLADHGGASPATTSASCPSRTWAGPGRPVRRRRRRDRLPARFRPALGLRPLTRALARPPRCWWRWR